MKVRGANKVLGNLRKFGDDGESKIEVITKITALEISKDAKQKAPVDLGKLKQSINATQENKYKWWVNVNVVYGAYVEFGTGTFVEVAPEWKDLAMMYYKNGKGYMTPRPFLYPAYVKGREQYVKDLEAALNHLVNKFNS